jgi:protoporphyrin/coproporphyrin ferrochelatase
MKKGILLVTMGSPSNRKQMRSFLLHMFQDASILPFPKLFRNIVAHIISSLRYKNSWAKYELIGGSPLKQSMDVIGEALAKESCFDLEVYSAYSYDEPLIEDGIKYLYDKGVNEIQVIPMYPQYAISTTGSVIREILKMRVMYKNIDIRVADEFYENALFIKFWTTLIKETMAEPGLSNPLLLFSAHSIPEYQSKEDSYVHAIETSAELISQSVGLKHKVSYQSKIGRVKWVGPDTIDMLKQLAAIGTEEIIIVPISFLNENLETLYDLDHLIVPFAKDQLNIPNVFRVRIPEAHPLMIQFLGNIIR